MHLSTHNWMRAEPLEVTLKRITKLGYESIEISGEPEQYKTAETRALHKEYGSSRWGPVTLTVVHGPQLLAAVAATLYAPINLVYPAMGHLVITKAFVIIILGGMGSVPGAIVGGLIIGFAESFGAFYISTDYKDIIAFMLLVFILSLRPQGLFTKGVR